MAAARARGSNGGGSHTVTAAKLRLAMASMASRDTKVSVLCSGLLSIDNNVPEQHIKTVANGRKNWLFTGSENGGKTMAVLFSLVSSCRRHGHDPFAYLRHVLERLPDHSRDRLVELLPDRWSSPKPADESAPEDEPAK